jgi:uncharacterized glyoxalase superfamily protein PhnB
MSTDAPDIIPTLRYDDARAAITWLVDTLGFTPSFVTPETGEKVGHAQLRWGNGMVMLASKTDGGDGRLAVEQGPSWVYVVVDDIDAHHARAVERGAEILQPLTEEGYGGKGYSVRDPEGNVWSVGTYRPELA